MFSSVSINHFRCFDALSIESLERVNLVAGKNNAGKTAFLEALFLLANGPNILPVSALATLRGIQTLHQDVGSELLFGPLFFAFNRESIIKISGLVEKGKQHAVELQMVADTTLRLAFDDAIAQKVESAASDLANQKLRLQYTGPSGKIYRSRMWIEDRDVRVEAIARNSPFTIHFLTPNAHQSYETDATRFGRLQASKDPYKLLESLKIVEPRLQGLATIFTAGTPILHCDIGLNHTVPLFLMGTGLRRLVSILLAIANAPQGIVLIDEIEKGMHYSVLSQVWQAIGHAARRFNVQVFATTHNAECIRAAYRAFVKHKSDDFRLHRLERDDKGAITAVTYDREALEAAVVTKFEMR